MLFTLVFPLFFSTDFFTAAFTPARSAGDATSTIRAQNAAPAEDNMVWVEGGTYEMGDQFSLSGNGQPIHSVTVTGFYIASCEVTFKSFDAFCVATGRTLPADEGWGRDQRPVIHVDWYDAVEYCNWRSVQESRSPVYTIEKTASDPANKCPNDTKRWTVTANWSANGYRLPTEAEWEYAARERGRNVRFATGHDVADPFEMNFASSSEYKTPFSIAGGYRHQTVPVDALSANSLGLKNMSGNVWEWCWDWYDAKFYTTSSGARDPRGAAAGLSRCGRGGNWLRGPFDCQAAYRSACFPYLRTREIGFRVVRR